MLIKIVAIVSMIIGEFLSVYTEMLAAQHIEQGGNLHLSIFSKYFLLLAVGGGFIIIGYMLGMQIFKNIWTVSIISIMPILIIEPTLAWLMFRHTPTFGGTLGLIFAFLAIISTTLL